MTAVAIVLLAIFAGYAQAAICPQETHTVCNSDIFEYRCICAVALVEEPTPEQSCNGIVDPNDEDFSAASVTFNLDESAEHHEEFPETRFREAVASSVRVDKDQIIVLRVRCREDEGEEEGERQKLIVQFAIRKKDAAGAELPLKKAQLIDASSVVTRMKALGHLSQLADLDVSKIEEVEQLMPVEGVGDNVTLFLIALVSAMLILLSCALGIFKVVRASQYTDIDGEEP